MTKAEDSRLVATRNIAMDAALAIAIEEGVSSITHASVSKKTGISRSTLYRHWPKLGRLRNDAFLQASRPDKDLPLRTHGPLRTDLTWLLGLLMSALNEKPWGKIAPQVIALASTNEEMHAVISDFMAERMANVEAVFTAAEARGELVPDAPVRHLVEMAVAVPYFRKLISGLPLDHEWLDGHVDLICRLAVRAES